MMTWRTHFNSSYKNVYKPFNMLLTVFKILAQFSTYHNTGFTTKQIIVCERSQNASCTVWNRHKCHSHNWKPSNMAWFPIITAELVTAVVLKHPNSLSNINNTVTEEGSSVETKCCLGRKDAPAKMTSRPVLYPFTCSFPKLLFISCSYEVQHNIPIS